MPVNTSGEKQGQFTPVDKLAQWVVGLYITSAIVIIVYVVLDKAHARLVGRIATVQTIVVVISFILFLIWVYRTHKNLPHLDVKGLRFTPGWSVGWFFVPIMNLFRPYQVVSEAWRASYPAADISDAESWKRVKTLPIVGWWWALCLISSITTLVAGQLPSMWLSGQVDSLTVSRTYMASYITTIVFIVLTVLMVREISRFQEAKYRLISSPQQKLGEVKDE
ncbi:MAG: DUF4328 domain-containing protein [Dehalococcoidales bacterium]|nr:DUF4328 domain-containing protein [Dehalococcoidales bacterium]